MQVDFSFLFGNGIEFLEEGGILQMLPQQCCRWRVVSVSSLYGPHSWPWLGYYLISFEWRLHWCWGSLCCGHIPIRFALEKSRSHPSDECLLILMRYPS